MRITSYADSGSWPHGCGYGYLKLITTSAFSLLVQTTYELFGKKTMIKQRSYKNLKFLYQSCQIDKLGWREKNFKTKYFPLSFWSIRNWSFKYRISKNKKNLFILKGKNNSHDVFEKFQKTLKIKELRSN